MNDKVGIKLDTVEWILRERGILRPAPRRNEKPAVLAAWQIQISYDAGGVAYVTVDDLQPFRVPPVLGFLAHILALETDNGDRNRPEDPLVPYKSYEEILSKMAEVLGREFTDRALKQAVCRLRKILKRHDLDGLLQNSRLKRAYRLAVRRKKGPAVATGL